MDGTLKSFSTDLNCAEKQKKTMQKQQFRQKYNKTGDFSSVAQIVYHAKLQWNGFVLQLESGELKKICYILNHITPSEEECGHTRKPNVCIYFF